MLTLRRYLLHAFEALQKPGSEEISAVMPSTSRVFGDFFLLEISSDKNVDWKTMGMNFKTHMMVLLGFKGPDLLFKKFDLPKLFYYRP